MVIVKPGLYRHFKGGQYLVIGVAMHTETLEPMVVYLPLYNEMDLMTRPLAKFVEPLTKAQRSKFKVPEGCDRFTLLRGYDNAVTQAKLEEPPDRGPTPFDVPATAPTKEM